MDDGQQDHSGSGTSTQGSEHTYETDSSTDSDDELHCGAGPYWVVVAAETSNRYQARRRQSDDRRRARGPHNKFLGGGGR